jgi:hypothetical protein
MAAQPKGDGLSEQRKYRTFSVQQKLEIVLAGLRADHGARVPVCDLGRVALAFLDYREVVVLEDDALERRHFMPPLDHEADRVGPDLRIVLERQPDPLLASGIAALADELSRPRVANVLFDPAHALIEGAEHRLGRAQLPLLRVHLCPERGSRSFATSPARPVFSITRNPSRSATICAWVKG